MNGYGKRVNPNSFIEEGIFRDGDYLEATSDGVVSKTNLNDYVDYLNPCIDTVKQAAAKDP